MSVSFTQFLFRLVFSEVIKNEKIKVNIQKSWQSNKLRSNRKRINGQMRNEYPTITIVIQIFSIYISTLYTSCLTSLIILCWKLFEHEFFHANSWGVDFYFKGFEFYCMARLSHCQTNYIYYYVIYFPIKCPHYPFLLHCQIEYIPGEATETVFILFVFLLEKRYC